MALIQTTVSGGIMIILIAVLHLIFARRLPKKVFVILWEIALVRLLLPISLPIAVLPPIEQPTVGAFSADAQAQTVYPMLPSYQDDFEAQGVAAENPPTEQAEPEKPHFKISLKAVWAAGTALSGLAFLASYLVAIKRFSRSFEADSEYISDWRFVRGVGKRIRIRICDGISSPMTYGIFRPTVLFPADSDLNEQKKTGYILEHEYSHIRHHDSLKKVVATAALCIHWFNPAVWVMYFLFNRDMELWCDECVIRRYGEKSRADYARMLISMEELRGNTALVSAIRKNSVEERIVAIMKYKKATFISVIAAIVLVAVITVGVAATSLKPVHKEAEAAPLSDEITPYTDGSPAVTEAVTEAPEAAAPEEAPENNESKKAVYNSNVVITDCRQDGEKVKGTRNSAIIRFNEGERAIIVYDFGYTLTDKERKLAVTAGVYANDSSPDFIDTNPANNKDLFVTNVVETDTAVIFMFEAPYNADYIFAGCNFNDEWLYADDYYVEKESAAEKGKFGEITLKDDIFNGACQEVTQENIDALVETLYGGYPEFTSPLTPLNRTEAIDDDVNYVEFGDTFSDYYEFISADGRFNHVDGIKGLDYKIDSATVYDSVGESGLEGVKFTDAYAGCKFIVLDMTATYNRPDSSAPEAVQPYFTWSPMVMQSKLSEGAGPNFSTEIAYLSETPREGDINIATGEPFTVGKDGAHFRTPISDGSSLSFKVGLYASDELIESGNLYLCRFVFRTFAEEPKLTYAKVVE